MGQSLAKPSNEPAGAFQHSASGSTVQVFWKEGRLHHEVNERGLTADYPVAYAIGAGKVGKSYLVELGGHLFQSPASYYARHSEWGASPGYESERILDFSRPITSDCLFCHAGSVKPGAVETALAPISCDRCHGPSDRHRQHPYPGTILNPAKLTGRARDSICEQCHIEGATVVLNPGRYWWDFHPGEALEEVETNYVYRSAEDQPRSIAAVSQAEQLVLSACWRGSGGKLWCGTCHDPHGEPVNRAQQIRQICTSCHSSSQVAANHSANQAAAQEDCVACHMPSRRAEDVSHAAVTDHRIARKPSAAAAEARPTDSIAPWYAAKAEFADRNLGLALFNVARKRQSAGDFEQAFGLLSKLPAGQEDAEVSAARGYMLLGSGRAQAAVNCFKNSVQREPGSGEYWLDLAVAQEAVENPTAAIEAFRQSIRATPYDYRPYKGLADQYQRTGDGAQGHAVLDEFLRLVPQSILMRLEQSSLH